MGPAFLIVGAPEAEQKHGIPRKVPAGNWHAVTSSHVPCLEVVTWPSSKQAWQVCVLEKHSTSGEIRNDCDHVNSLPHAVLLVTRVPCPPT